jgi:hypothetical protein
VVAAARTHWSRLLRNADHSFDAAHNATDDTTDDTTDDGADRAGSALTHGHALLASADNALGLRSYGRRKSDNNNGNGELHFHGQSPLFETCSFRQQTGGCNPTLWREREANAAIDQQNRS